MMRLSVATIFLFMLILCALMALCVGCGDDDDDAAGQADQTQDDDDSFGDDDDDSWGEDDDDDTTDDDDDDQQPDVEDEIAACKDWLAIPEPDRARECFLEVLDDYPDHPVVLYGLVVSDLVHTTDIFSVIVDYVMSVIEYGGPVKREDPYSGEDFLDSILQAALDGLLGDRARELIEIAEQARQAGGTFSHENIPIFIHYEQVCSLSGQFDEADLYASRAFAELFFGLIHHLYAVNLDFDISHFFRFEGLPVDDMEPIEIVSAAVQIFLELLTDPAYPDFLTLPEENEPVFAQSGLLVGDGLDDWLSTFEAIKAETDDQTDDLMGYVDLNGDFTYDEIEPFFIPHYGVLDDQQMLMLIAINQVVADLRDAFYDQTEKDVDPDNPNLFDISSLNAILGALGWPQLIPSWEIDIGAMYANPGNDGLKDTLVLILQILDAALPDYHWR